MLKIEHIGIAVKELSVSIPLFEKLLNSSCYKTEKVDITKFIDKKGEGIHHIAFEVEDIEAEMERLKAEGFTLLNEKPKPGADNKLVCFLHPKGTNSVLIELCMENKA
ncbi:MAG: VOC family protein [Chitinophagia bacterium]|nr:VOC family protein [Chitinophagia bacterium]